MSKLATAAIRSTAILACIALACVPGWASDPGQLVECDASTFVSPIARGVDNGTGAGKTEAIDPLDIEQFLVDEYLARWGIVLSKPAYIFRDNSDAWLSTAYLDHRLYRLFVYSDDTVSSWELSLSNRPASIHRTLTVVVDHGNTNIADVMDTLLVDAQDRINRDHGDYAAQIGLAEPIVEFDFINLLVSADEFADPLQGPKTPARVYELVTSRGLLLDDYDLIVVMDPDPAHQAGGFAYYGGTWAYIGWFFAPVEGFVTLTDYQLLGREVDGRGGLAWALYHHEVGHTWGWEHEWGIPDGALITHPPLFGWTDTDGDDVPEILDNNPYGGPCTTEVDADSDGITTCAGDCNDSNPACASDCTFDLCDTVSDVAMLDSSASIGGSSAILAGFRDPETGNFGVHINGCADVEFVSPIRFPSAFFPLSIHAVEPFDGGSDDEVGIYGIRDNGLGLFQVRDSATGVTINNTYFPKTIEPRGLAVAGSAVGTPSPIAALIGINTDTGRGEVLVKWLDADVVLQRAFLNPAFTPKAVTLAATGGTEAATEIVSLSQRPNLSLVQIFDIVTGARLRNVYFASIDDARAVRVIDIGGNPAIAVYGNHKILDRRVVELRDFVTGNFIRTTAAHRDYPGKSFAILPSFSGTPEPEVAQIGELPSNGLGLIQVRDLLSGTRLSNLFYGRAFDSRAVVHVKGSTNDGVPVLAVLQKRRDSGRIRVLVNDAMGNSICRYFVENEAQAVPPKNLVRRLDSDM